VTVAEIFDRVGWHYRGGRARCPFHQGNNPSALSFSDTGFVCFNCGEKGGVRKLQEHFDLRIELERDPDAPGDAEGVEIAEADPRNWGRPTPPPTVRILRALQAAQTAKLDEWTRLHWTAVQLLEHASGYLDEARALRGAEIGPKALIAASWEDALDAAARCWGSAMTILDRVDPLLGCNCGREPHVTLD